MKELYSANYKAMLRDIKDIDCVFNKWWWKNWRSVYEKWTIGLNVRPKTIKFIEENIGENLCDPGLGKDFLDTTPKAHSIKNQIGKLDFIKI